MDRGVAFALVLWRDRLEEPPAHDLEALICGRGSPRGLHPTDNVEDPRQRLPTPLTADLDIGRGDRDHQHRVWHLARCIGERLSKRELGIEGAGRETILPVEL